MQVRLLLLICLMCAAILNANDLEPLPCAAGEEVHVMNFETRGGLPIVQASVNGITGNFILDLGSADIILNERYFEAARPSAQPPSGINTRKVEAGELKIKKLQWQSLFAENVWTFVVDLSHLEESKGLAIHGLIGHKIVKEYEIILDYVNEVVLLCKLDPDGNKLCVPYAEQLPTSSLDINFSGHLACVTAFAGKHKLRLALDSGAEINILDIRLKKRLLPYLEQKGDYLIRGISSENQRVEYTKVRELFIDSKDYPLMRTVLSDLSSLSANIDGILGYEFFVRCQKVAINFKQRKLHIWHLPDVPQQPKKEIVQRIISP